jgi:hypothetical protein
MVVWLEGNDGTGWGQFGLNLINIEIIMFLKLQKVSKFR